MTYSRRIFHEKGIEGGPEKTNRLFWRISGAHIRAYNEHYNRDHVKVFKITYTRIFRVGLNPRSLSYTKNFRAKTIGNFVKTSGSKILSQFLGPSPDRTKMPRLQSVGMIPVFQRNTAECATTEGRRLSRLEHLSVDAAPSSFPTFQLVHCPPSFL